LKELQHKDETERVTHLLSQLNIACKGKAAMTKLEWTGKYDKNKDVSESEVVELDSDDEEDPLNILSQVSRSYMKHLFKHLNNLFLLQEQVYNKYNLYYCSLQKLAFIKRKLYAKYLRKVSSSLKI